MGFALAEQLAIQNRIAMAAMCDGPEKDKSTPIFMMCIYRCGSRWDGPVRMWAGYGEEVEEGEEGVRGEEGGKGR